MKRIILIAVAFLSVNAAFAQKVTLSIYANTNLYHYTGNGAESESFINQTPIAGSDFTNNPYGKKNGVGYGLGAQLQWVGKSRFILGTKAGYEQLNSKVSITNVYPYLSFAQFSNYLYSGRNAAGRTYLKNSTLNIAPYIGYRIKLRNASLDVLPGIDIGITLKSQESGKAATDDRVTYTTSLKRQKPPVDLRPGMGLALGFNKYAVTVGYAHGIKALTSQYVGGDGNVNSEVWRFSISYQLF